MSQTKQRRPRLPMLRTYTPLTITEIRRIDRFGFDRQIRPRSQAARQLILMGLRAQRASEARP
jgi:hypothetical protein